MGLLDSTDGLFSYYQILTVYIYIHFQQITYSMVGYSGNSQTYHLVPKNKCFYTILLCLKNIKKLTVFPNCTGHGCNIGFTFVAIT